ncbi:MAG: hypothetical protein ACFE9D_03540 [Promethearchaeota archaeon]
MPIFRTDRYVKVTVTDFKLTKSSEALLQVLQKVTALRNVQMTKVQRNREEQGRIRVEEWYEITGSLNVPEGGKSFWVISKPSTEKEPYNFFMRVDRNIEANNYEDAQKKATTWLNRTIIKPLDAAFSIAASSVTPPEDISQLASR